MIAAPPPGYYNKCKLNKGTAMKRFLKYVEIQTKITSVFAFLLALAYLWAQGYAIRWGATLVFFAAMFLFDLTTTAVNNYMGSKHHGEPPHYGKTAGKLIIFLLLALSMAGGLWLVSITDIIVLLAGGLCFLFGILYSFGPVPISATPLGEALSGLFYGFFIPFLLLHINLPAGSLLSLSLVGQTLHISTNLVILLHLLLLCVTPVLTTANIMLANNICDMDKDKATARYTLPQYLGRKSVYLFAGLYYLCYGVIIVMAAAGVISPICLLSLLTIIPVQRNIKRFFAEQVKSKTFVVSVKNYVIIMGALTLTVFLGGFVG
jgi:1,4-dihydroxy-2-naphthoate octaprenyltransferase